MNDLTICCIAIFLCVFFGGAIWSEWLQERQQREKGRTLTFEGTAKRHDREFDLRLRRQQIRAVK